MNYTKTVLNIAYNEIGYLEKKSNKELDDKTANAGGNNFTKYGRDMVSLIGEPYAQGVAWCDTFVDWCFVKAYGIAEAKKLLNGWSAYTPTSASYYKHKKAYYDNPKVGDQVFFQNASGQICHTGLVYNVDNTYVYTIEGNASGASGVTANGGGVVKKKYLLTYNRIDGYGRPEYDAYSEEKWIQEDKGWWYQFPNGEYARDGWFLINDKFYCFDKDGWLLTDQYIKSEDYFENKTLYYVTESGDWDGLSYEWIENDKGWWLSQIGSDWYPKSQWAYIDNKWYYFDNRGYVIRNQGYPIDGVTYQFDSDGALIE